MKTYTLITIVFMITIVSSCKDASTNPERVSLPKIYLESEYTNYAWGYVNRGWFVDPLGNIISYDIAKSGTQWISNASEYYTEEEICAKIHHKDTLRGLVRADTLKMLHELALSSVGGLYSDTSCPARDMGSFVYSSYIYVPDSLKYRQFVLRVDGDCRYYNTSESAIALSNWIAHR